MNTIRHNPRPSAYGSCCKWLSGVLIVLQVVVLVGTVQHFATTHHTAGRDASAKHAHGATDDAERTAPEPGAAELQANHDYAPHYGLAACELWQSFSRCAVEVHPVV